MSDNSNPARYQRVLQILDAAAGPSAANYQGAGRFWHLPVPQLLKFKLYGVQMIADAGSAPPAAPAPSPLPVMGGGSCCHGGAGTPPASPTPAPQPGRGAASGLIRGLRGQFPFDGSQFPQLPWGGMPVAAADIDFIEKWIDDGCPTEDAAPAAPESSVKAISQLRTSNVNSFKASRSELTLRRNVESLLPDEVETLRETFRALMALNAWQLDNRSYNSWAQIHGDECPHGWSAFLPWHRIYLYQFEQALQDVTPGIALPYWRWEAATTEQIAAGYVPLPYQCFLNEDALARLHGKVSSSLFAVLQNLGSATFTSITKMIDAIRKQGADVTADERSLLITELKTVNPLWTDMRFPGEFPAGQWAQFHHHYPSKDDIDGILQVDSWRQFGGGLDVDDSFGLLDMDPHNTMHIWAGGYDLNDPTFQTTGFMLNNLTAAFDPIFWGHHANVDRIWAMWQDKHPGVDPNDPSDILAGLDATVADSVSYRKLGYEYASATYMFATDGSREHAALGTGDAGVPASALQSHRKVDLRLHNIQQPSTSFAVRVFLNQPDADVNTSIIDNPHYVGSFSIFGHGACIGGPGHCDPRPRGVRKFDRRPRHHNEPWDLRIDVTDAVKRMVGKGESDLQVKLVVVGGMDIERGKLQLEGISLRFED
ncbi:MAG: tyrosinase family protein [Acidobacteria bacterium]|nr:tyrosinase family protein [Acidobacteriota bacterium]